MDTLTCAICQKPVTKDSLDAVLIGEKGSEGINRASKERNNIISTKPGQLVHKICRQDFCKPQNIQRALKEAKGESISPQKRRSLTRSSDNLFSFQTDCFYCGTEAFGADDKKSRPRDVFKVTTVETKDKVLKVCSNRSDTWAATVRSRVLQVHDLPAADAVYHKTCSSNFRTGKQIPQAYSNPENSSKKRKTAGRPQNEDKYEAFLATVKYREENDEELLLTISDLQTKMSEYLDENQCAYGFTHMKEKLIDHFGNDVVITEINGLSNVVALKRTADSVLKEFHKSQKNKLSQDDEKKAIIQTAARLIKQEIKNVTTTGASYPQIEDDAEHHVEFLTESLKTFLSIIFAGKNRVKLASIGQSIMQEVRPRALMAPLQIGLAVQLHHNYASRFLIDTLHSLGFCSSYNEVQTFSQNASVDQATDIPSFSREFVQYSADNSDHNIRTLDGKGTFHGMGMVASVTPGTSHSHPVPRRNSIDPAEISAAGHVQMFPPTEPRGPFTLLYKNTVIREVPDPCLNITLLWKMSMLFDCDARSNWSGMMQAAIVGEKHPKKSSVFFLPMIDHNPNDETCIYSTLKFFAEHAQKHGLSCAIVTFDQPLWWKAFNLIQTEPPGGPISNVIVRLGAFHMQMSFLGYIGYLMADSGLKDLLELAYASNAVVHMLSGKAIARAVHGHLLVDAALNTLLIASALGVQIPKFASKEHIITSGADDNDSSEIPGTECDVTLLKEKEDNQVMNIDNETEVASETDNRSGTDVIAEKTNTVLKMGPTFYQKHVSSLKNFLRERFPGKK
ncbi:uncharacterized protein LOC114574641 [Exaiptasia diaphana]|uniref:Uncharacterized protein n=1 Tax=Exaiptasia diaphana TaxID=2652724 RepID=A0A913YGR3_EXADI|nr:uncharacterized protein LOC114574641 [Exaiptasia diaphana]XP_028513606.1 uncharacterized protein LOC114574641 [Exaiptasia diaphana]